MSAEYHPSIHVVLVGLVTNSSPKIETVAPFSQDPVTFIVFDRTVSHSVGVSIVGVSTAVSITTLVATALLAGLPRTSL
jgi:hypothetical protein